MTTQEFIDKNTGVGLDFDNAYGFQCMDLFEFYNRDVVGAAFAGGNAIDVENTFDKAKYDWVANSPEGVPVFGDVVIWGQAIGQYGHIAVFVTGDQNNFTSFDQNWPTGTVCHEQSHNYNGVLGWLHPKPQGTFVDAETFGRLVDESTKYEAIKNAGYPTVDAVTKKVSQLQKLLDLANQQLNDVTQLYNKDEEELKIASTPQLPPQTPVVSNPSVLDSIHSVVYSKWSLLPGNNFWVTRLHQLKYIFEKT